MKLDLTDLEPLFVLQVLELGPQQRHANLQVDRFVPATAIHQTFTVVDGLIDVNQFRWKHFLQHLRNETHLFPVLNRSRDQKNAQDRLVAQFKLVWGARQPLML